MTLSFFRVFRVFRGPHVFKGREMLEGERIVLRHIKEDDIDTLFDLTRQYPDMDKLFPMSLLSELIVTKHFEHDDPAKESNACLLITDKTGDIIGSIAYFKEHPYAGDVELAYHIFRPAHRKKGFMSEALHLITAYLFETKNIPIIRINLEKGNTGSRKTAEKCGFTFDGAIKNPPRSGDALLDIETFSLLREKWKNFLGKKSLKKKV